MCAGEGCFRYSRSRNRTAGWGSYLYRWPDFVGNLSALYPDIRGSLLMRFDRSRCFDAVFFFRFRAGFIGTTDAWTPVLNPVPKSYDVHVYQTPRARLCSPSRRC